MLRLPRIIGHRGIMGYSSFPENTTQIIELAHRVGFTGVEFDVQMTKDKKLIVYHDETLDSLSDGSGFVYDCCFGDIMKHKLNYVLSEQTYHIPSFSDIMKTIDKLNLFANIEIKSYYTDTTYNSEMVDCLMKEILSNYQHRMSRMLFSTFSPTIIDLLDDYRKKYGIHYAPIDYYPISKISPSALVYNFTYFNSHRLNYLKQLNYPLIAYNVINKSQADRIFKLGINSVIMDKI